MNDSEFKIPPAGEIWAVVGGDAVSRSAWCARLAHHEDLESTTALLSFAQHAGFAQLTGWPAARYYEDEGVTVGEFLSYDSVYEINPFEIGAKRPETRRAYNQRKEFLMRLLDLRPLRENLVIALSNGETRRTLLARALAKGPKLLVLDDPAAGLDFKQRAKLREIISALAARGLAVLISARHTDELPAQVTKAVRIDAKGHTKIVAYHGDTTPVESDIPSALAIVTQSQAEPVVEIKSLTLAYGSRQLFTDFSWTIRRGERWILRGDNGSGKTTLFALITGDSPMAYAADISVFGIPRETGCELQKIRARIGMVSPEMQAYLARHPMDLIDEALAKKSELLLLDEPFMNMDRADAKRAARKISAHLKAHPQVTAILICHRTDEAPKCFDHELNLS